jgi:glycosyltransferase involved in cell wall biosynthesis
MTPGEPRPALSFVVPVYNEEGNVGPLHAELTATARATGRPYELVFVNDGSNDATLERLLAVAREDPHLRVVELDGNFGEAAALSAGFEAATGDVVVTLDGDGQNDPADVPRLLAALDERRDAVSGRRSRRKEKFTTRILPSLLANRLIVLATGVPAYDCGCGLKAYRRTLVRGAQLPSGFNRFLPAILGVAPERVAEVVVGDRARGSGTSHYGLWRIAVVLRDLPSLPLLTRLRAPLDATTKALLAALVALVVLAGFFDEHGGIGVTLVLASAALLVQAARFNVDRMRRARAHGVYRVRRVYHGTAVTDRDRGRGLLGQEPAPDVR